MVPVRWSRPPGRFRAVHTVPMRLREQVIGALNLFRAALGPFDAASERIVRPWPTSLPSDCPQERVIEQANGRLAERFGIGMDQEFSLLRHQARSSNQRRTDIARQCVNSTSDDVPAPARSRA